MRLAFIWACENIAVNTPTLFEEDLPLFASLLGDGNERVRIEAPEIFRVLGGRIPEAVLPYHEALQILSESDENKVVRIHAAGAVRAIDKACNKKNGFVKKTQKAPKMEIDRAKAYRDDYLERCDENEKI